MKTIVAMSLAFAALVACADGVVTNEVVTNTPTYTPPTMEELMQKFYEEKNATEQGRVFLHGKVAEERQVERDGTNYTQVVYADGYIHERVMHKARPRYDIKDRAAQERRMRKFPERLKQLHDRRKEVMSTTNEVTVIEYSNGKKEIIFPDGRKEMY